MPTVRLNNGSVYDITDTSFDAFKARAAQRGDQYEVMDAFSTKAGEYLIPRSNQAKFMERAAAQGDEPKLIGKPPPLYARIAEGVGKVLPKALMEPSRWESPEPPPGFKNPGFVSNLGRSIERGAGQTGIDLMNAIPILQRFSPSHQLSNLIANRISPGAAQTGEQELQDFIDLAKNEFDGDAGRKPVIPVSENPILKYLEKTAYATGEMTPAMAEGILLNAQTGGTAGTVMWGMQGAGDIRDRLRNEYGTQNPWMTDLAALAGGIPYALSEKIGAEKLLSAMPWLKKTLFEVGNEDVQDVIQSLAEGIGSKLGKAKNKKYTPTEELRTIFENAPQYVGPMGILGGGGSLIQRLQNPRIQNTPPTEKPTVQSSIIPPLPPREDVDKIPMGDVAKQQEPAVTGLPTEATLEASEQFREAAQAEGLLPEEPAAPQPLKQGKNGEYNYPIKRGDHLRTENGEIVSFFRGKGNWIDVQARDKDTGNMDVVGVNLSTANLYPTGENIHTEKRRANMAALQAKKKEQTEISAGWMGKYLFDNGMTVEEPDKKKYPYMWEDWNKLPSDLKGKNGKGYKPDILVEMLKTDGYLHDETFHGPDLLAKLAGNKGYTKKTQWEPSNDYYKQLVEEQEAANAVQKQGANEMDVRQQTQNGERVGEQNKELEKITRQVEEKIITQEIANENYPPVYRPEKNDKQNQETPDKEKITEEQVYSWRDNPGAMPGEPISTMEGGRASLYEYQDSNGDLRYSPVDSAGKLIQPFEGKNTSFATLASAKLAAMEHVKKQEHGQSIKSAGERLAQMAREMKQQQGQRVAEAGDRYSLLDKKLFGNKIKPMSTPETAHGSNNPLASKAMSEQERRGNAIVTPEQDAAYLNAAESGDIETAQEIVDKTARKFIDTVLKDSNTPRDAFGNPVPDANIQYFGATYGPRKDEGYYALSLAGSITKNIKSKSFDDAIRQAEEYGYVVKNKTLDGYNYPEANLTHKNAETALKLLFREHADKFADVVPVYVRYGNFPIGGKSKNYRDNILERGVSVFSAMLNRNGEISIKPSHQYEVGSLLMGGLKERPLYVVEGKNIGNGSDGEPILSSVKKLTIKQAVKKHFLNTDKIVKHYADPILKKSSGKIIPLSERFNPFNPSPRGQGAESPLRYSLRNPAEYKYSDIQNLNPIGIPKGKIDRIAAEKIYWTTPSAVNKHDGKSISFVKSAFGKLARHKEHELIFRLIPLLKQIAEEAIPIYSELERNPQKHTNIKQYGNYLSKIEADEEPYFVRLTTQEVRDGRNELHNIRVSDIEITKAGSESDISAISKAGSNSLKSGSDNKLNEWLSNVKPSIKESAKDYADTALTTLPTTDRLLSETEVSPNAREDLFNPEYQPEFTFETAEGEKGSISNKTVQAPMAGRPGLPRTIQHQTHRSRFRERLTEIGNITLTDVTINSVRDAAEMLYELRSPYNEKLTLLPINADNTVKNCGPVILSIGALGQSLLNPKSVLEALKTTKCDKFILCHNHPGGNPVNSTDDVSSTKIITSMLEKLGMEEKFIDHIILNGKQFWSIKEQRYINYAPKKSPREKTLPLNVLGSGWGAGEIENGSINPATGETVSEESLPTLNSPERVADYLKTILYNGELKESTILLGINAQNKPVSVNIVKTKTLNKALFDVAATPGVSGVLMGQFDNPDFLDLTKHRLTLEDAGIRVIDIVNITQTGTGYQSALKDHWMMEPRTPYTVTKSQPLSIRENKATPDKKIISDLDKQINISIQHQRQNFEKAEKLQWKFWKPGKPKPLEIATVRDMHLSMHDLQVKTGLPFFDFQQAIRRCFRDAVYDSARDMDDLFKGLKLVPNDVRNNPELEHRLTEYIATGKKPKGMTEDEITLSDRIVQLFKTWENLVKRIRHATYMRTGELPPDVKNPAIMAEGKKIREEKGKEAWEKWIDEQDFGLRTKYLPWMHETRLTIQQPEANAFGRGFAKTRGTQENLPPEAETGDYDILGSTYRYILRARKIEKVEPTMLKLKGLFETQEFTDLLKRDKFGNTPNLIDRYFDTLLNHQKDMDKFQKVLSHGTGHFFRVVIPMNIIKWCGRDSLQNLAIAFPKTFNPTDPIWWTKFHKFYSQYYKLFHGHKFRDLIEDKEVNTFFHRYVIGLDAIMENYTNMELNDWERLPGVAGGYLRKFMSINDTVGGWYSLIDRTNRLGAFSYGYSTAKDCLERFRKDPTKGNLNRFLNTTGLIHAPELTQKNIMDLLNQNRDKEAAMQAGKFLSDSTNFLYQRGDKGLDWQARGVGGDVLAPIATYSKGMAQEIGMDSVKPIVDLAKVLSSGRKPSSMEIQRAWRGLIYLAGLCAMGELANAIWYNVVDDPRKNYGLKSIAYMPFSGPILSLFAKASGLMMAWEVDKSVSGLTAAGANQAGNVLIPGYRMTNKLIGTALDRDRYSVPTEMVRYFKSQDETYLDTRRWTKLDIIQKFQRTLFDGAYSQGKMELIRKYMDYNKETDLDGKYELKQELIRELQKYPVSTKRKDIPRTVENIENLIPDIGDYNPEGFKEKESQRTYRPHPPRPPRPRRPRYP